jgi:hypothetical protein
MKMTDILAALERIGPKKSPLDGDRDLMLRAAKEIRRLRVRILELEDPHFLKGREAEIERLRAENEDLFEAFQEILNIGIRVGNAALKRE